MTILSDLDVSHKSLTPLHIQIQRQIRELILSGTYPTGSRLPSETQLQQHLNVSRTTVRVALHSIEAEGLIERIPGKGTFVADIRLGNGKYSDRYTIHFMTHDFDNRSQRLLLTGAESFARASGYQIMFRNSVHDFHEEKSLLEEARQQGASGVVLWSTLHQQLIPDLIEVINNQRFPCVMMDRTIDALDCDYVASDNYAGGRQAMQHLLDLGHQHIVFLTHSYLTLLPVAERVRAYRAALHEAGLPHNDLWSVGQPDTEINGSQFMRALEFPHESPLVQQVVSCLRETAPTAIFALNDYMGVLAMKAARIVGLRVPEDISIIGFDDADIACFLEIPLTTIAQDTYRIGQRAAEMLAERMEGCNHPRRWEFIPTELRARASTAPPSR